MGREGAERLAGSRESGNVMRSFSRAEFADLDLGCATLVVLMGFKMNGLMRFDVKSTHLTL